MSCLARDRRHKAVRGGPAAGRPARFVGKNRSRPPFPAFPCFAPAMPGFFGEGRAVPCARRPGPP